MAAGLQGGACSGDQVFDDFKAGWSCEDSSAGLEFADFELDFVFFRLADVGRIGNNEIEGTRFETVEQIGVMEKETAFGFVLVPAELKLEAGGVGLGNFACGGGVVGGVDLSAGQFLREGKRDGPGAGADVGDLGIL